METLVGLLLLAVGVNIGMQINGFKPRRKIEDKPEVNDKQKELDEHFEGLLNYDTTQAYRGR